jgi:hypothetical protein
MSEPAKTKKPRAKRLRGAALDEAERRLADLTADLLRSAVKAGMSRKDATRVVEEIAVNFEHGNVT